MGRNKELDCASRKPLFVGRLLHEMNHTVHWLSYHDGLFLPMNRSTYSIDETNTRKTACCCCVLALAPMGAAASTGKKDHKYAYQDFTPPPAPEKPKVVRHTPQKNAMGVRKGPPPKKPKPTAPEVRPPSPPYGGRKAMPVVRDPRIVPSRFVHFEDLKAHGRLPRFGSNSKYRHPVTKEGNANLCRHREDFGLRTVFVFVSHFWGNEQEDEEVIAQHEVQSLPSEVRAVAANKNRERWQKMSWYERKVAAERIEEKDVGKDVMKRLRDVKLDLRDEREERVAKLHPDDAERRKFHLIVSAIDKLRGNARTLLPDRTEVALWIDWCCIDQDKRAERDSWVAKEVRNMHNLIASCDFVLTPIVDPDHKKWKYPEAWAPSQGISQAASLAYSRGRAVKLDQDDNEEEEEAPAETGTMFGVGKKKQRAPLYQYLAEEWAMYWSRAWCGTEAFLTATMRHAKPDQAIVLRGALANAIKMGKRAHLVYGTKEMEEGLFPVFLPPCLTSVLDEWQPVHYGFLGREADKVFLTELLDLGKKHLAVSRYDKDGDGDLDEKEISAMDHSTEEEGWNGGYAGRGDGHGRYVNPDGSWVEGDFVKSQLCGKGRSMDATGEIYEGEFDGHRRYLSEAYGPKYGQARIMRGRRNGQGTQLCPNGDLYEGQFVDSQREGKGRCVYALGDVYDGEWKDGERSGEGKMITVDGNEYVGQWKKGAKHGRGKMTYAPYEEDTPREVYHGAWKDDVRSGQGRHTYSDGSSYYGTWQADARHGPGKWTAPGVSSILLEFDEDGNGQLDVDEFKQLVERLSTLNECDHLKQEGEEEEEDSTPDELVVPAPVMTVDKEEEARQSVERIMLQLTKEHRRSVSTSGGWATLTWEGKVDRLDKMEQQGHITWDHAKEEKEATAAKVKARDEARAAAQANAQAEVEAAFQAKVQAAKAKAAAVQAKASKEKGLQKNGGTKNLVSAMESSGAPTRKWSDAMMNAVFEEFDDDESGELSYKELRGALRALGGLELNGASASSYEGEWADGMRHGKGKQRDLNVVYEGQFERDAWHGQGVWKRREKGVTSQTGEEYKGGFAEGERHGSGTLRYADGGVYEATWENGVPRGKGRWLTPHGAVYEGEFVNEKRDGWGTYTFADDEDEGGLYTGNWRAGVAHGQGRRVFADGTFYEGEWRNGLLNGRGVQFKPDGLSYEGQFRASLRHGKGRMRKSPAVAETIEDGLNALKAMAHVKKARELGEAKKAREAQIAKEMAEIKEQEARKEARKSMAYSGAPGADEALAAAEPEAKARPGVLHVLVHRAEGLRGADLGGRSSDPYVVAKIGAQELRTRTIKRSLNPDWEQTLEFRGNLGEFLTLNLELSVRDHDEITRDDDLGSLVLPLRHQLEHADTKELQLDLPSTPRARGSYSNTPPSARSRPATYASRLHCCGSARQAVPPAQVAGLPRPVEAGGKRLHSERHDDARRRAFGRRHPRHPHCAVLSARHGSARARGQLDGGWDGRGGHDASRVLQGHPHEHRPLVVGVRTLVKDNGFRLRGAPPPPPKYNLVGCISYLSLYKNVREFDPRCAPSLHLINLYLGHPRPRS